MAITYNLHPCNHQCVVKIVIPNASYKNQPHTTHPHASIYRYRMQNETQFASIQSIHLSLHVYFLLIVTIMLPFAKNENEIFVEKPTKTKKQKKNIKNQTKMPNKTKRVYSGVCGYRSWCWFRGCSRREEYARCRVHLCPIPIHTANL